MTDTTKTDVAKKPEFVIHRLFIKDLSFEAPDSPKTFKEQWEPVVDLNLNNDNQHLEDDLYNVTLKVTVTAKIKDKVVFVAEVKQSGIFLVKDFDKEQKEELLGSFCPNVLFPYAREAISDVINRGGFPPLYLAPINFDAIYQQGKAQANAKKD
jgi:preprotein translocase subunit SecB